MKSLFAFHAAHPARALLWLAFLVYLIPSAWKIGEPDVVSFMEQMSLLPSQETWLRLQQGDEEAWSTPTLRGEPQIRTPPMLIWLNLLAWSGLEEGIATPEVLTLRARWLAWFLGLTGVFSTFWIGAKLYDPLTGARAALVLASVYSVLKQARMATFDTHLLGWVPLAVAASLALGRRREAWDLWVFYVVGAVAAICAFLTKGALVTVYLLPPLAVMVLLTDRTRIHILRMFSPFLTGLYVYAAWLLISLGSAPGTGEFPGDEILQTQVDPQPVFYYLVVAGMVFPWTLLWLAQFTELRKARLREAAPWLVLLLGIFILGIVYNRHQRYLIPLLPWFAIGFSHFWQIRDPDSLAMRLGGRLHAGLFFFLSLVLPAAVALQGWGVEKGYLQHMELPGAGVGAAILLALWAVPLAAAMLWSAFRQRSRYLVPMTALWLAGGYAFAMHFYVHSYHGRYPYKAEADRLARDTRWKNTYWTAVPDRPSTAPDDRLLYHSGRFFRPVPWTNSFEAGDVVCMPASHADAVPQGWQKVGTYTGLRAYTLWEVGSAAQTPAP
jgi:4-amino-4-deoxy-L-arabinose transferase-like glycosyltransferase